MLICFAFGLSSSKVAAATKEISDISPGSVVSVNGVKFVKLNNNNQFVAVAPSICPNFATGMYMQDFTSQMCANAPTPSGTDYFPIGILIDQRDNKQYEVRKFADGNCWMVDNLAYGGADLNNGEDGCLKTTYCGYGYNADNTCITAGANATSTVDKIAPGLYGDCRYPYTSTTTADTNKYGYLYSWQAVMQDANAYAGQTYQPPQPTQGICPDGWYVPTGGASGQFQALHTVSGAPNRGGFWYPGGNWGATLADAVEPDNTLLRPTTGREPIAFYSTSTSRDATTIFTATIVGNANIANTGGDTNKGRGISVRCLKSP